MYHHTRHFKGGINREMIFPATDHVNVFELERQLEKLYEGEPEMFKAVNADIWRDSPDHLTQVGRYRAQITLRRREIEQQGDPVDVREMYGL